MNIIIIIHSMDLHGVSLMSDMKPDWHIHVSTNLGIH